MHSTHPARDLRSRTRSRRRVLITLLATSHTFIACSDEAHDVVGDRAEVDVARVEGAAEVLLSLIHI